MVGFSELLKTFLFVGLFGKSFGSLDEFFLALISLAVQFSKGRLSHLSFFLKYNLFYQCCWVLEIS